MVSNQLVGNEVSVEQFSEYDPAAARKSRSKRTPTWQVVCPECDGRLVNDGHESYCAECGLVVSDAPLDLRPTRAVHGPSRRSGPQEWSLESINPLRVDKGLHTTFFLGSDGYGKPLSQAQKDKFGRLRQKHRRFQMDSDRAIRLNEGLRDIEMIGGNLALPDYVVEEAAQVLKQAGAARLPGGWMSWEALAAGAVLLTAGDADLDRSSREVACYGKTTHERLSAAARKLRCELDIDYPPVRPDPVEQVLGALSDALDEGTYLQFRRVAQQLLELADEVPIGPGTSRLTIAAAAVYAADRLTDGKQLTQAQVITAASTIVNTSKSKIATYSRELYDAYVDSYGDADPVVVIAAPGGAGID